MFRRPKISICMESHPQTTQPARLSPGASYQSTVTNHPAQSFSFLAFHGGVEVKTPIESWDLSEPS